MANTTNYNWETPDDTDLVKDGAAAIRTLGSSVDTTTKALNPSTTLGDIEYRSATANTNTRLGIGTTGQVLTVAGGVPTWATCDDANAIQNAIVDAKGDLIAASAADTPARLAVGANGTVLTADSAEATGLKWAAPSGGGSTFVGANVVSTTDQSISNATFTMANFGSENFDTNTFHNNSTNNSRMTIPSGKDGYYLVTCVIQFGSNDTGFRAVILNKNGNDYQNLSWVDADSGNNIWTSGSTTVSCVATDYLEIEVYQNSGGALDVKAGSNFTISYLGA